MSLQLRRLLTDTFQREVRKSLLQYAYSNRKHFNDVEIITSTHRISANKLVLCCFSQYFEEAFLLGSKETNENSIHFPNIDGSIMNMLIEFIYTGKIIIDSDNVLKVLEAADELELDDVKNFCFRFLQTCITPMNCFTILNAIEKYRNIELRNEVYSCISLHYYETVQTSAFRESSYNVFFACVFQMCQQFKINQEEMFRSMLDWIRYDEQRRKSYLSTLIKFVDMKKYSYALVYNLLRDNLVKNNADSLNLLENRMQEICRSETKILTSKGKYSKKKIRIVLELSDATETTYPQLPLKFLSHCLMKMKNFLYCIGYCKSKSVTCSQVLSLDLDQEVWNWKEIGSLNTKRKHMSGAVWNDTLVLCGGEDENGVVSSAEAFKRKHNCSYFISSLNEERIRSELVSSGRYLYSIGGCNGTKVTSSMERLSKLDQKWKFVSPMGAARKQFAAAFCNDSIYAVGGVDDEGNVLESVEKYMCSVNQWMYVSNLTVGRYRHSACVLRGKIYIIGGKNAKKQPTKVMERFDGTSETSSLQWENVGNTKYKLVDHCAIGL